MSRGIRGDCRDVLGRGEGGGGVCLRTLTFRRRDARVPSAFLVRPGDRTSFIACGDGTCFFSASWFESLPCRFRVVSVSLPCLARYSLVLFSSFFRPFFEIDGLPSRNRVLIKYGYPSVQLLTG